MKILPITQLAFLLLPSIFIGCGSNTSEVTIENNSTTENEKDSTLQLDSSDVSVEIIIPDDSIYTYQIYSNDRALYGFKNKKGVVVVKPKFDLAGNFNNGFAPVINNGVHGFIDTTGKMTRKLKKYTFSIFQNEISGEEFIEGCSEGLFLVIDEAGKYGFVDAEANLVIPCIYDGAQGFSQGRAIVVQKELFGFIDTSGTIIVKPKYELAYLFSDSLACVQIDGKRGFIDLSGKLVIPAVYTQAFYFSEGLCNVTKSSEYTNYFYIDKTGKTVIEGPFQNAAPFYNGEALVEKRSKCRIIDKTGKQLRSAGEECFVGC